MAFLLLGMALYFGKPFVEKLVTPAVFWWLLFAVVVAAGALLAVRSIKYSRTAWGPVVGVAVALLLVAPSFVVIRQLAVERYQWMPYSDKALADARRNNRVTLVEFTADWCGNCHWLEANVLKRDDVVKTVAANDVVMLKADVTDVDAKELEARKLLNRYSPKASIPLTLIYSPNLSEPIQLTGIYSRQDLIDAIRRAADAKPALATGQ
jgi:thiol:disulfide interchange protein DsbD